MRQDYVDAVDQLQRKLGIPPIDMLFDKVIELTQVGAKSVMAIQYVKDENKNHISPELMHAGSFRWRNIDSISGSVYTKNEEIWSQLTSYHDNIRGNDLYCVFLPCIVCKVRKIEYAIWTSY